MAVPGFQTDDDDALMTEINMTPLVDVMLVLLIVFLVTIPVLNHAVKGEPAAGGQPARRPQTQQYRRERAGRRQRVWWNKKEMNPTELKAAIATAAAQTRSPRSISTRIGPCVMRRLPT